MSLLQPLLHISHHALPCYFYFGKEIGGCTRINSGQVHASYNCPSHRPHCTQGAQLWPTDGSSRSILLHPPCLHHACSLSSCSLQERLRSVRETLRLHSSFPGDHRSCDWNTWRCCQFLMPFPTICQFLIHPSITELLWKFCGSSMIHSSMPSCPLCCAPCFKAHYCILMTACQYHWQLFQFVVQIMHNSLPVKWKKWENQTETNFLTHCPLPVILVKVFSHSLMPDNRFEYFKFLSVSMGEIRIILRRFFWNFVYIDCVKSVKILFVDHEQWTLGCIKYEN